MVCVRGERDFISNTLIMINIIEILFIFLDLPGNILVGGLGISPNDMFVACSCEIIHVRTQNPLHYERSLSLVSINLESSDHRPTPTTVDFRDYRIYFIIYGQSS